MAKYKPAGKSKKGDRKSAVAALPCLFLILAIFGVVMLLFYFVLKSNS